MTAEGADLIVGCVFAIRSERPVHGMCGGAPEICIYLHIPKEPGRRSSVLPLRA
jgi:hypothetical protein